MKLQCIRQLFSLFLPTKAIPTIYLQTANHFCVFSIHIQRRKMRRKENERKVSSQAKCAKFSAKSEPKSKKFECWCPRTYNCPSLHSSAAILSDWGPQIWPPFYMAMPPPSPPPQPLLVWGGCVSMGWPLAGMVTHPWLWLGVKQGLTRFWRPTSSTVG